MSNAVSALENNGPDPKWYHLAINDLLVCFLRDSRWLRNNGAVLAVFGVLLSTGARLLEVLLAQLSTLAVRGIMVMLFFGGIHGFIVLIHFLFFSLC